MFTTQHQFNLDRFFEDNWFAVPFQHLWNANILIAKTDILEHLFINVSSIYYTEPCEDTSAPKHSAVDIQKEQILSKKRIEIQ